MVLPFKVVLEVGTREIRQGKKGIWIGKGEKKESLFTDEKITYEGDPKESTIKL